MGGRGGGARTLAALYQLRECHQAAASSVLRMRMSPAHATRPHHCRHVLERRHELGVAVNRSAIRLTCHREDKRNGQAESIILTAVTGRAISWGRN